MALYKTETCVGVDEKIIKVKVKCMSLVCKKMQGETNIKQKGMHEYSSVHINSNTATHFLTFHCH
jgi:hypothetical protein